MLELFSNYIPLLLSFAVGFTLSYIMVMIHYKMLDLSYILTTIKEDIINLHVSVSNLLEKAKK